jgi:hypothetical protein
MRKQESLLIRRRATPQGGEANVTRLLIRRRATPQGGEASEILQTVLDHANFHDQKVVRVHMGLKTGIQDRMIQHQLSSEDQRSGKLRELSHPDQTTEQGLPCQDLTTEHH